LLLILIFQNIFAADNGAAWSGHSIVFKIGHLNEANDFRRVALHELGHADGLAHSAAVNVLMSASANNTYLPVLDDVNSLANKYGAATHVLTIENKDNGYVSLQPKVSGTGVLASNVLHTSNYESFLACYVLQ
jgi:hypothetical protein